MRKIIIALLLAVLLVPGVSAADDVVPYGVEYEYMMILHCAYYINGTEYVIAADSAGEPYYYVDGILTPGAGLVFVDGYYYYVRTDGNLAYNREYTITTSNGLLPVDRYTFDANGRLVDPPSLPEGWEEEWSDVWPFPTEPSETTPPATDPADLEEPPKLTDAFTVVMLPFAGPLGWFVEILSGANALGAYLVVFAIGAILRLVVRPFIGDSSSKRKAGED